MRVNYSVTDLIRFEDDIASLFLDKKIHSPIHLSGGNEEQLIEVFRNHVNQEDWVLCSWRSHYACLLKGVPPDELREAIIAGRSISLCFPQYRILSSGIVGGTAPIAVGLAIGIKRKSEQRKVVCFLGDMAAESGIVHESIKYAVNFDLPILFVVEDNGLSVATDTRCAWGGIWTYPLYWNDSNKIIRYKYQLTRPHVGVGKHVTF